MTLPIVLADRAYIPLKYVDEDIVEKNFVRKLYKDAACEKCDYYQERHCDICDDCPNYEGTVKLYTEREINGHDFVGVSIGKVAHVGKILNNQYSHDELRTIDKRATTKMRYKYRFLGQLYDYQKTALSQAIRAGYGLINAPARSGKTVMGSFLALRLGYKTLILADQIDFLQGFYETLCGSETQPALTDIPDVEKFHGKKLAGFCNRLEEFKKYDICLATYQTFLSPNGQKLLQKIKKLFGFLIVDEVHKTAAKCFSKVVNTFWAKHRYGLTATVKRKDGRDFIVGHVIGPVVAKPAVETLKPRVVFVETGAKPKNEYKTFVGALRFLEKAKGRNELIVDHVMRDIKAGHHIVIPVAFKSHVTTLVDMINKKAGKTIAAGFVGGGGKQNKDYRRKIVLAARQGKIKVVIGIRKIVQIGINVPKWSCIYEITPISNPPNFYQEISRVLTPMENKPQPIVRFFLDNLGASRGCLRTCLYKDGLYSMGAIIPKDQQKIAGKYTSKSKHIVTANEGGDPFGGMRRL